MKIYKGLWKQMGIDGNEIKKLTANKVVPEEKLDVPPLPVSKPDNLLSNLNTPFLRQKITPTIITLLFALLLYVLTAPFQTLYFIKLGIHENNQNRLAHNIDYSTLQTNLESQIATKSQKNERNSSELQEFSTLDTTIVDNIIDEFINSQQLFTLLGGDENYEQQSFKDKSSFLFDAEYRLKDFSTLVMIPADSKVELILKRIGTSWQLVDFTIPADYFFQN